MMRRINPKRTITKACRAMCLLLLCTVMTVCLFAQAPSARAAQNEEQDWDILLIGQDSSENGAAGRSDVMILCSFRKASNELILTSVLRDLYVPIPGHGSNRINAAYAIGGMPLLKQTMEENLELEIDGCVQVDFSQFAQIIDLLGGVEVELREDEAATVNRETGSSLSAGRQKLTGQQALAYTRIRTLDADGDFSRTNRQRKVLHALWNGYKNSSFPTLVRTMGRILPMLQTDMQSGELLSAAVHAFPGLKQIRVVSQTIPGEGQYRDSTIQGMAVLEADMVAVRENLHKSLNGNGT